MYPPDGEKLPKGVVVFYFILSILGFIACVWTISVLNYIGGVM